MELHGDAIVLERDGEIPRVPGGKVAFLHFEGVAPSRYATMFLASDERKRDGIALSPALRSSDKAVPEYLDSYRDFEAKVVEHWSALGADAGPQDADSGA